MVMMMVIMKTMTMMLTFSQSGVFVNTSERSMSMYSRLGQLCGHELGLHQRFELNVTEILKNETSSALLKMYNCEHNVLNECPYKLFAWQRFA